MKAKQNTKNIQNKIKKNKLSRVVGNTSREKASRESYTHKKRVEVKREQEVQS